MVQVVMGFIDEAPSADKRLSVIETLRTVTEGKVLLIPEMHEPLINMRV